MTCYVSRRQLRRSEEHEKEAIPNIDEQHAFFALEVVRNCTTSLKKRTEVK
jgi:hypothetical protein